MSLGICMLLENVHFVIANACVTTKGNFLVNEFEIAVISIFWDYLQIKAFMSSSINQMEILLKEIASLQVKILQSQSCSAEAQWHILVWLCHSSYCYHFYRNFFFPHSFDNTCSYKNIANINLRRNLSILH